MKLSDRLPPCFYHFTLAIEFLLQVPYLASQGFLPGLLEIVLILPLLHFHLLYHVDLVQRLGGINFIFHAFGIGYNFVEDLFLGQDIKFGFAQTLTWFVHSTLAGRGGNKRNVAGVTPGLLNEEWLDSFLGVQDCFFDVGHIDHLFIDNSFHDFLIEGAHARVVQVQPLLFHFSHFSHFNVEPVYITFL